MTKEELQKGLLNKAKDHNMFILEWATGIGKSFGACELINYWKPDSLLLIVAEESHKMNWMKELTKWSQMNEPLFIRGKSHVVIECYASLHKYKNTKWDLIILDEVHHTSDLRESYLKTMQVDKVICLSATIDKEIKDMLKESLFKDKKGFYSRVSIVQAIRWGLLPEPDIYLIPLKLNDTIRCIQINEYWGVKDKRVLINCSYPDACKFRNRQKYPNVNLTIQCTQKEASEYWDNKVEYLRRQFMKTYQEFNKIKWLHAGSERKRLLGNMKTQKVLEMLNCNDKRTVVYCTSIEQADELQAKSVKNSEVIHSKRSKNENVKALEDFDKGLVNLIFCVGKLTEGQNLKNIEAGVIIQLDGKERPFVQKHGRILRSEEPAQYIFYWKDTRDEEYLQKICEGIDPQYITELEVGELWK